MQLADSHLSLVLGGGKMMEDWDEHPVASVRDGKPKILLTRKVGWQYGWEKQDLLHDRKRPFPMDQHGSQTSQ